MAPLTTAASGDQFPRSGSSAKPSRPTGRRSASASSKKTSGSRLFRFDRALGVRFVAGADEAGRGCLAGPLVAAAVLFDYESLTLTDRRSLSALNDSKQHSLEMREVLYPRVLRAATRVAVTSRCVRGIDERGLHKTNLAALTRHAAPGRRGGRDLSVGRVPGAADGLRSAPRRRRRRDERGDRGRVGDRQGHARSLHAADGRALPGLGVRAPMSATRRPSIAPRSPSRASRRCTGCRSRRWRISSSRCDLLHFRH